MAPPTVLIANDEEKDKVIANLKAELEDEKTARKAMDEEHDKTKAKLKASDDKIAEPGPVVKAIIAGMDDDHKKDAKARAIKAMDDETDEVAKAKAIKAIEDVFETGNGVNTNATETEKEKELGAELKALTADAVKPIINKILSAKVAAGADEKLITSETARLSAMTLSAIKKEYSENAILIEKELAASQIPETESLIASEERGFEFNGHTGPLVGNAIDIDACVEAAHL